MERYLVDSNVFLRFLLKDHQKHYQTAKNYFLQAKEGKVTLILIPQIIMEIDYVLRRVYHLTRKKSADLLLKLAKSPHLEVQNQEILIEAIEKYKKINIDLLDLFIYESARKEKAQILSFDKDFKKIKFKI